MTVEAHRNHLGFLGAATERFGQELYWLLRGDPKLFHEAPEKLPTNARKLWALSSEEVATFLGPIYPSSQLEPDLEDRLVLNTWLTAFLTIQKIAQTKILSDAKKGRYPQLVIDACVEISTRRIGQAFPDLDKRGISKYLNTAIMEASGIFSLVNKKLSKSSDRNPQILSSDTSVIEAAKKTALHNLQLERCNCPPS